MKVLAKIIKAAFVRTAGQQLHLQQLRSERQMRLQPWRGG
jgi:hypothetical protein